VGIALSAIRGRWTCCVHSPRRCFLGGPAGGRGRELLLNIMALEMITGKGSYQIPAEVLHGGYAFDSRSTGAASSSEINFALGSRRNPASEQTVVDTSAGRDCRFLASQVLGFENFPQRGVEFPCALSPGLSQWVMTTLAASTAEHQWSSGRIHRCHRCDLVSIPGRCVG
jgi:hypothetical protein